MTELQNTLCSDFETIIRLLGPTMPQLAAAFGVSRQCVHEWRNGQNISVTNAGQINELLTAARIIEEVFPNPPSRATQRKLLHGKCFWDAIANGTSPIVATNELLRRLKREDVERKALMNSLSMRKTVRTDEVPLFSEKFAE